MNKSTKTRTLREMKGGQSGRIVRFQADDPSYLHKMMALGVLPGEHMEVLQTFPAYVIKLGHTQLALDKYLAQIVEVEVIIR